MLELLSKQNHLFTKQKTFLCGIICYYVGKYFIILSYSVVVLLVAIMLYLQAKPNITYSDRCIPIGLYSLK